MRGKCPPAVNNPLSDRFSERALCSAADPGAEQGRPAIAAGGDETGFGQLAPVEELERNAILVEVVHREIAGVFPVPIGDRDHRMAPDSALDPKLGAPE